MNAVLHRAPILAIAGVCSLVLLGVGTPAKAFSGTGDGNEDSPYQISTCLQLQSIADDLSAHYILSGNVDCTVTSVDNWNSGAGFLPIGSGQESVFTGTLEGSGYTINNLYINRLGDNQVGLFASVSGATIQNLTMDGGAIYGNRMVGGLVGDVLSGSHITNVHVNNEIHAQDYGSANIVGRSHESFYERDTATGMVTGNDEAGGLIGESTSDQIDMSMSHSAVSGRYGVGGLIGSANGATITNTYANNAVSGGSYVGGLTGYNLWTSIANSYSTGDVTGSSLTGGLVGYLENSTIHDSFSASTVSPADGHEVGLGLIGSGFGLVSNIVNSFYNSDGGQICAATAFGGSPDGGANPCTGVSFSQHASDFYRNISAPLDTWNFGSVWHQRADDYPDLSIYDRLDMLCEESTSTATTIHAHCLYQSENNITYSPDTWEARYRVHGSSDDWTSVTMADPPIGVVNLTGLSPGTQYDVQFRFSNFWEVSQWGTVEAQTAAATPIASPTHTSTPPTIVTVPALTVLNSQIAAVSEAAKQIVLDDYNGYSSGGSQQLDLSLGQVVYFMVNGERHSATVKELGSDYVVLTIASTPFDVRIALGDSQDVSVHQDGTKDLSISLISLQDGKAQLAFAKPQADSTTSKAGRTPITANIWVLLALFIAMGYWVFATRHKEEH